MLKLGVGAIEHERPPAGRRRQAQDHPQRCRLPGPVGPEEARDRSRFQHERQIRDRHNLAEALGQRLGLDDRCHLRPRVWSD